MAGKVAFQAHGTRHILTNDAVSLSKRCGLLILYPMCAVGQARKTEETDPDSRRRFLRTDKHVPGSDAIGSEPLQRCERHNRNGEAGGAPDG